jgi:hypothetical protein
MNIQLSQFSLLSLLLGLYMTKVSDGNMGVTGRVGDILTCNVGMLRVKDPYAFN